ncbi:protein tyrosine phosphatase domain-containing protein 1-like [Onthophagus taurus]|uniref:protein tyrosine phosphatase domain-containing protein 1-like n=1 Tax=Onthophagus taurus TaxID=166361 RepID=UPI0039BE7260
MRTQYDRARIFKLLKKTMDDVRELKSPNATSELVAANYNKLSDHIRRLTPQGIQCSVFCGGINCKYENPDNWTADSLAVQGIYSHWITSDILAMARPSTILIVKKNILQQFESLGIKSIINLQCPREHASCGQPLESSGFSYDPNIFMENKIYYYNFAWKDYGDATLLGLLNMVKVLAFATSEGRVAVHCHAGLGRTGVLISCYLVYSLKAEANDAIKYVRYKRPGSVQTRGQIVCVRHFASFILPRRLTFFIKECEKEKYMAPFNLARFLRRQKVLFHGYDERMYKYFPKIIHVICERILKLCGCWVNEFPQNWNIPITTDFFCSKSGNGVVRHESLYSICSNASESNLLSPDTLNSPSNEHFLTIPSAPSSPHPSDCSDTFSDLDTDDINEDLLAENKCFQELENENLLWEPQQIMIQDVRIVENALLVDFSTLDGEKRKEVRKLQTDINNSQSGWLKLEVETDLIVLCSMLHDWIESLKEPIITTNDMENIVINYKQPELCFSHFEIKSAFLIEYLLHFLSKINPITELTRTCILRRFLAALSHQTVVINDVVVPQNKGFGKLREGTLTCAIEFFESLYTVLDSYHQSQKNFLTENKEFFESAEEKSDF